MREDGDADDLSVQARCEADRTVTRECNMFLAELAERYTSRDVLDQALRLRDRNELIVALQTSLVELAESAGGADYDNARTLLHSLTDAGADDVGPLSRAAAARPWFGAIAAAARRQPRASPGPALHPRPPAPRWE